ncbi:MAG: hypothetical protein L3J58_11710 [Emcibacter sp.]|nr:hypothetical protein [Emcibacter sp.]
MKAIQVRYLGATNSRGGRLKAFSDAGSLTEPRDYEVNIDEQSKRLVLRYLIEKTWGGNCIISGQGTLPNGDEVFTLSRL